ncbi:MAG: transposase, partial [Oscillospiraceae bacterium]
DMWKPYAELANNLFPKATQIVDKYHYIRQAIWAFEAVRKQEQSHLSAGHRKYFKRSKSLLTKRFEFLDQEEKQQVNVMLYSSATLSSAHFLKEKFLSIRDEKDSANAKQLLSKWIVISQNSDISQFKRCADTYIRWSRGILNTFDVPFSNGFTEGCNNKIKVLKRNAYGYRNFNRFRNRILHMFAC